MPVEVTISDYRGDRTHIIPDEYFEKYPRLERNEWEYAGYDKFHCCTLGDVLAHSLSLVEKYGNEATLTFEASGDSDDGYSIEATVNWSRPETDHEWYHRVGRFYDQEVRLEAERKAHADRTEQIERQMYESLKAKYGDKV